MSHEEISSDLDGDSSVGLDDSDEIEIELKDVIEAFIAAVPEPTDQQVHSLAAVLGMSHEEFEEHFFKLFGELVKKAVDEDTDADDSDDALEDVDEAIDAESPIDLFIVTFVMYNNTPSEEQVHALASILQVTPEELEERIYKLMNDLVEEGSIDDILLVDQGIDPPLKENESQKLDKDVPFVDDKDPKYQEVVDNVGSEDGDTPLDVDGLKSPTVEDTTKFML